MIQEVPHNLQIGEFSVGPRIKLEFLERGLKNLIKKWKWYCFLIVNLEGAIVFFVSRLGN